MERNHNVQVGDIFEHSSTSETGHSCGFVQVVKLRGKTMVDYTPIRMECYVDETCDEARWECRVRPLPGQFSDPEQVFAARVYRSNLDGEECLSQPGRWGKLLYPYDEEKYRYKVTGYDGAYVRDRMGPEKKVVL